MFPKTILRYSQLPREYVDEVFRFNLCYSDVEEALLDTLLSPGVLSRDGLIVLLQSQLSCLYPSYKLVQPVITASVSDDTIRSYIHRAYAAYSKYQDVLNEMEFRRKLLADID